MLGVGWTAAIVLPSISAEAAKPPNVPVPPSLEIEILDPNADPLGNPTVELIESLCRCDDNLTVDIPPVVIVHKYYYTGDRSFQGPMLPGGPSIVVFNHPKTGERMYVPVQMLPGAPTVRYSNHGIEYDYGRYGITVGFGVLGKPKVTYRNRTPVTRQVKDAATTVAEGAGQVAEAARIAEVTNGAAAGVKNLVVNTGAGVEAIGGMLVAPFVQIIQATPIGSLIRGNPEEQATRDRDRDVRCEAAKAYRSDAFIPTLR